MEGHKCAVCGKTEKEGHLQRCARCKVTFYCSKEHQVTNKKCHTHIPRLLFFALILIQSIEIVTPPSTIFKRSKIGRRDTKQFASPLWRKEKKFMTSDKWGTPRTAPGYISEFLLLHASSLRSNP